MYLVLGHYNVTSKYEKLLRHLILVQDSLLTSTYNPAHYSDFVSKRMYVMGFLTYR